VFVVEALFNSVGVAKPSTRDHQPTNLDKSLALVVTPCTEDDELFERWGDIHSSARTSSDQILDMQSMFKVKARPWVGCNTLESYFNTDVPRDKLTINQRIQLALIVTYSVLYLSDVKPSCQPIDISKFRYYSLTGEQDDVWDESDPLVRRPYHRQDSIFSGKQPLQSLNPIADLRLRLL
jgi:hypothetical protein